MIKKFIFSCEIFGGFEMMIEFESWSPPDLQELVRVCVDKLNQFLIHHHLNQLSAELKLKKYHIHDKTIENIMSQDCPVYICNCSK